MNKHQHCGSVCEHKNIQFCKQCKIPHCESCGKEWRESAYNWIWNGYPYYSRNYTLTTSVQNAAEANLTSNTAATCTHGTK